MHSPISVPVSENLVMQEVYYLDLELRWRTTPMARVIKVRGRIKNKMAEVNRSSKGCA